MPLSAVGWEARFYTSLRSFDIVSHLGVMQEGTELPACDPNDSHTLHLLRYIGEASFWRKITELEGQSLPRNSSSVVGTKYLPKAKRPSALN